MSTNTSPTLQWAPVTGAILTSNAANFTWTSAPGVSFYETCLDQEAVNNGLCDSGWLTAAQATSRLLTGLTDGTYWWQVRATTPSGNAPADNGVWWSLTIDAPDPIREYVYLGGKLLAALTLTPKRSWDSYNIEQQAVIAQQIYEDPKRFPNIIPKR